MAAGLLLTTEADCALAIGPWPRFRYDARGGGGLSRPVEGKPDGWQGLTFDPDALRIPSLSARTTRFLGLPLPPGLRIAIQPQRLEGQWHPASGRVELIFEARFHLLVAGRPVAPELRVATRLTTAEARGQRHQVRGQLLTGEGPGVLVGLATVSPTGEAWLDRFLRLPDEALAVLRCCLRPCDITQENLQVFP
jgi:hypothetical protein